MRDRAAFLQGMVDLDLRSLVFVDEMGCNQAMALSYGWAPRGKRLESHVPKARGRRITSIGALSLDGLLTLDQLEGSNDNVAFEEWVRRYLVPVLRPGNVVVMDNLKQHKQIIVQELIAQAGAVILFTPAYSPEFNAIEEAWSKIKHFVRRVGPRTRDALLEVLALARHIVTRSDALGWISHAGYTGYAPIST